MEEEELLIIMKIKDNLSFFFLIKKSRLFSYIIPQSSPQKVTSLNNILIYAIQFEKYNTKK